MKASHTPVPWFVNAGSTNGKLDHQIYSDKDNRTIIAQIVHRDNLSTGEIDANAAFIVKACNNHVDLLEALQELLAHTRQYLDIGSVGGKEAELVLRAEAAIAKATGGAQ